MKPLREFFGLERAIDVTTATVECYQRARMETGKARATVNRETGALKQAFNLALRRTPPRLTRAPYVPTLTEDNARQGVL
jgi:hypothetical protein